MIFQLLQVQGLGQRYFSASRAQTDLQKCLSILHTDQPVPAGVRSDFAVFALDARYVARENTKNWCCVYCSWKHWNNKLYV